MAARPRELGRRRNASRSRANIPTEFINQLRALFNIFSQLILCFISFYLKNISSLMLLIVINSKKIVK